MSWVLFSLFDNYFSVLPLVEPVSYFEDATLSYCSFDLILILRYVSVTKSTPI